MTYRLITTKDGVQTSNYNASNSQVAGLYCLAREIEAYVNQGFKIMLDPASKTKYVLQNGAITIAVELVKVESQPSALDLRNAALAVVSSDEDTTPVQTITEAAN